MARKVFYVLLVLLCAVGCKPSATMVIRGTAPIECEGLNVYLVPQPYPKAEQVDSTVIRDGRFEFEVDAAEVRMCDITISRKSPVPFQRLLVMIEPGEVEVEIGEVSMGGGTQLNDELAEWKRVLSTAGNRADELRAEIAKQSDKAVIDSLKAEMEKAYAEAERRTIEIIENNLNPMGGFLYMVAGRKIDSVSRQRLIDLGIEKWKPQREK
ncbi:MAG: DUF4369 domain-containing protein [Rikenellaceae bacterium]|nr:DUF4369 domain-containing protein [Rikenellaceae bacterium]